MPSGVRDGEAWKDLQSGTAVRDGGTWKEAQELHVRDGGAWELFFESVAAETLRPVSDVSQGLWDGGTGGDGDGDLWDEIDETSPDDGTTYVAVFAGSLGGTRTSHFEVHLSNPTGSHSSSQTHTIRTRCRQSGDGSGWARVELWQGSTKIAESGLDSLPAAGGWDTISYQLTSTEAGNITNYDDLRLKIEGKVSDNGSLPLAGVHCTWAELEIS